MLDMDTPEDYHQMQKYCGDIQIPSKAEGYVIIKKGPLERHKIDSVVTDASERATAQMDRVEMLVGDTVDKVQGMVHTTQEGLLKPLREVSALVTGVKSGFGFLFKSRRPSVVHATQDEEMFI